MGDRELRYGRRAFDLLPPLDREGAPCGSGSRSGESPLDRLRDMRLAKNDSGRDALFHHVLGMRAMRSAQACGWVCTALLPICGVGLRGRLWRAEGDASRLVA